MQYQLTENSDVNLVDFSKCRYWDYLPEKSEWHMGFDKAVGGTLSAYNGYICAVDNAGCKYMTACRH